MTDKQIYYHERRRVILMCLALGYSHDEISHLTQMSLDAIKKACSRISRRYGSSSTGMTMAIALAVGLIPNPYDSEGNIRQEVVDNFLGVKEPPISSQSEAIPTPDGSTSSRC